jgi:4-diphosphocytidyl-2-C-methyl-D-erythritol kinase
MKKRIACSCSIDAPCKINLHLAVGPRRADGFHTIDSLFAALAFGDSLVFEAGGPPGSCELAVEWEVGGETPSVLPAEENLVIKALDLFREKTGFDGGLRIRLVKRIPLGAGLGGGSSDAASTLLALDSLAGTELPAGELEAMAAVLGSDVPFFLRGGAAWVSGRGEKVKAAPFPGDYAVLLVKPPFPSGTSRAFKLLDDRRALGETFKANSGRAGSFPPDNPSLFQNDDIFSGSPADWPFYNDFLPVLPESCAYLEILDELKGLGASFAGLSGSGSCCFGIFGDKVRAEGAKKALKYAKNFNKLTFFLAKINTIVVK